MEFRGTYDVLRSTRDGSPTFDELVRFDPVVVAVCTRLSDGSTKSYASISRNEISSADDEKDFSGPVTRPKYCSVKLCASSGEKRTETSGDENFDDIGQCSFDRIACGK